MKATKVDITPTKPQVFDMAYLASVPAHQTDTLRLFLSCDSIKARQGLTDKMWIPGSHAEAVARIQQFESIHGRAF